MEMLPATRTTALDTFLVVSFYFLMKIQSTIWVSVKQETETDD